MQNVSVNRDTVPSQLNIYKEKYEGQINIANNGQLMTIIEYKNKRDILVQFSDGTKVKTRIDKFKKGAVGNPNSSYNSRISINEIILLYYFSKIGFRRAPRGTIKEMGNFELDLYNPDVNGLKFAIEYDGCRWHQNIDKDERKNNLCKENHIVLFRVREKGCPILNNSYSLNYILQNCSLWSADLKEIINYIIEVINKISGTSFFIDVNLERDRDEIAELIIKYHREAQRLGEIRKMVNGREAQIIKYYSSTDVIIRYFDTGEEVNTTYCCFQKGKSKGGTSKRIQNKELIEKAEMLACIAKENEKLRLQQEKEIRLKIAEAARIAKQKQLEEERIAKEKAKKQAELEKQRAAKQAAIDKEKAAKAKAKEKERLIKEKAARLEKEKEKKAKKKTNVKKQLNENRIGQIVLDKNGIEHEIVECNSYFDVTLRNKLSNEIIEHCSLQPAPDGHIQLSNGLGSGNARFIKATNVASGECLKFKTQKLCGENLGFSKKGMYKAMKNGAPIKGYFLEYISATEYYTN